MRLFGKKYKCDTCGAKFNSESELKEHAKSHMPSAKQADSFKCDTCGMTFASQADLMAHAKNAHPMPAR